MAKEKPSRKTGEQKVGGKKSRGGKRVGAKVVGQLSEKKSRRRTTR